VRKADNLPPSCTVIMKSGNRNFLEPSGPLRARNGIDLPLPYHVGVIDSRNVSCLQGEQGSVL